MKWHPDMNDESNQQERGGVEVQAGLRFLGFERSAEARGVRFGEEGLKGQMPQSGGGGGEGSFQTRSPEDFYAELFGFSSPCNEAGRGSRSSIGDVFGSMRKSPPIDRQLPCSLEELFKGTTKKMKISREITDFIGRRKTVEEILVIEIKPGWKKGKRITFPKKGNVQPDFVPADFIFIIDEKPHERFTRDGDDLILSLEISLVEALTGYTAQVPRLDGCSLSIPINSIIHPSYEKVVPREGMPFPRDPSRRGDLRITFSIKFPTRLSSEQKAAARLLGSSS